MTKLSDAANITSPVSPTPQHVLSPVQGSPNHGIMALSVSVYMSGWQANSNR